MNRVDEELYQAGPKWNGIVKRINYRYIEEKPKGRRRMESLGRFTMGVKREQPKGQRNAYRVQIQSLSRYWTFLGTKDINDTYGSLDVGGDSVCVRSHIEDFFQNQRKQTKNPENRSCQKPAPSFLILFWSYLTTEENKKHRYWR